MFLELNRQSFHTWRSLKIVTALVDVCCFRRKKKKHMNVSERLGFVTALLQPSHDVVTRNTLHLQEMPHAQITQGPARNILEKRKANPSCLTAEVVW